MRRSYFPTYVSWFMLINMFICDEHELQCHFIFSRSPKRRRSRSNSRTRRSRHTRSRSRSRDRRYHSPRSSSQECREKERERRQKGLPPPKSKTLSSESSPIYKYGLSFINSITCSFSVNFSFCSLFQFAAQLSGWASWTREHNSRMLPVYWKSLDRSSPSV